MEEKIELFQQAGQMKWYSRDKGFIPRMASYVVGNTTIYVGGRPDYRPEGIDKDFVSSVEGWLSVTDRFIAYPPTAVSAWFPWRESGPPSPEVLYGTLKTLNYWIKELRLKTIYLNCDAGTHRSPSVFGAYLSTYYPDEVEKIVASVVLHNKNPEHHSCPKKYWDSYVVQYPELNRLTQCILNANDDPNWGYESLDTIIDMNDLSWSRLGS